MTSFIEDCRRTLQENGLAPTGLITDGALHRCPTTNKPQGKDGAYIIHIDGPCSLWWCNHRTGQSGTHTAKSEGSMTAAERQAFNARAKAKREQREADRQARNLEAAQKAQDILSNAQRATDDHPYLQKKQMPSLGLYLGRDNALIVPVMDNGGKVVSLQFIPPDGKGKRFLSGGKIAGGFFSIPAKDGNKDSTLCIAEGYATAASIHEATGYACLVAFNAGNIEAVTKMSRQHYPNRTIVICADNDHSTSDNVGISKATAAAKTINALLAIPPTIEGNKATDFNDLHLAQGLEAVKACIDSAENNHPQATEKKQNLCVVGIRELLELEVPPRHYLLHPIVPEQGLCMVFADRGTGKTFVALHIAYAVATGGQVFSWQSEQAWPVLYVDGEMPFSAMQSRIAALVVSADKEPHRGLF